MITVETFKKLYPNCKEPDEWISIMERLFEKYDMTTTKRQASFIAQCGHESGGWRVFSENLNYSSKALNVVFPKYFKNAGRDADEYHRQPEKIANVIYSERMGNGSTESGEGWRYRGRGPIQLTGKNNYIAFKDDMGVDVIDNPDLVSEDKEVALLSALWFWNKNKLNRYADNNDIKGMTRRINGGYIGLEDRIKHYTELMESLGEHIQTDVEDDDDSVDFEKFGVIRRGSRGEGVKLIQKCLGIEQDGIFGKGTERLVKMWQQSHGLVPDGIVGPMTLEKML